jgi:hypothetical protein
MGDRARAAFVVGLLGLAHGGARADSGAALGESARAASLGSAMTARGGDLSNVHFNPAGLGELARAEVALFGHAGRFHLDYGRTGEGMQRTERLVAGYGVTLGVRLPGPEWLERVRLGVSLHLPVEHVIRVRAPPRTDAPLAALYGARVERTALTTALAVALPGNVSLGVGLALTPTVWAPTSVDFDATRGDTTDEGVIVSAEREVRLEPAFVAGALVRPLPSLAIGAAFHQAIVSRAAGPTDLRAGPVRVDDPLDFTLFYDPEQWSIGVLFQPLSEISISADVVWARWSGYRTVLSEIPDPRFEDTVSIRAGGEWRRSFFAVRLGYAFEPSPVPPQVGRTTLIDADRHVLSAGLGLDLEPLASFPLRIDLHARVHAIGAASATKDAERLGDRDGVARGQQIADLGYPGFDARLGLVQLGLTVTIALSGSGR